MRPERRQAGPLWSVVWDSRLPTNMYVSGSVYGTEFGAHEHRQCLVIVVVIVVNLAGI